MAMIKDSVYRKTIVLTIALLLVVLLLTPAITESQAFKVLDRSGIADIIRDKLRVKGFTTATGIPRDIRVLPDIPCARIDVIEARDYGDLYVLFFDELYMSDNLVVEASDLKKKPSFSQDNVLDGALSDYYDKALDHFYAVIGKIRDGVSANVYDRLKVPGLQSIDVPVSYYKARTVVKPVLSLVLIGFHDIYSNKTYGPLIIYYIAFETRATLESGLPVRVLLVYSIVYDPSHIVYKTEYTVGYVTHVVLGKSGIGSIVSFMNALAVYGALGVFATVLAVVVKPDEHDKYVGLVIGFFALQTISIFIAIRLMGMSLQGALEAAIQLGHWLHILAFLWFPAYLLASYYYGIQYITLASIEETSLRQLTGLILSMLIAIVFLFITIIIPDQVLLTLTAYLGYNALFVFMLLVSGLIAFVGIQIGLLSAKMKILRTAMART